MAEEKNKQIQILKGFRDILPEHQKEWRFFKEISEMLAENYCFERIDLPVLEKTSLYVRGTGKHTDIVTKELYSFADKSGENVSLRPEFTPGLCRAYIEHGMLNKPQPVKLHTCGTIFRHDNPQAGRQRQFHQFEIDSFGSDSPVLDAEIIIVCYRLLEALGIPGKVHINSIGDQEDRAEYIAKLKQFLSSASRKKQLCQNCRERYGKNPLRILDCKESGCQTALEEAPQIVDFLSDEAKKHFMQTLEYLDDCEIEYQLDVRLVRGLDYYNRTTFEIYAKDEDPDKAQGALFGGGRYDGLMEILGGRSVPAVGAAGGVERIINKMREMQIALIKEKEIDVFVAQLGTEARKECFRLYDKLIKEGFRVGQNFSKDGLKAQLEKADQSKAKLSLILGQKELLEKTIIVRDMHSGIQEILNYEKIIAELKKRLDIRTNAVKTYRIAPSRPTSETGVENNGNDQTKEAGGKKTAGEKIADKNLENMEESADEENIFGEEYDDAGEKNDELNFDSLKKDEYY